MTKIYAVVMLMLISTFVTAQAPQAIKYQAIARDLTGDPVINQDIAVKISILQGSDFGPVVYSELHETATNAFGLFNLEIGEPVEILSGNFSEIGWRYFSHFLKIEIDITGGSNFQLMGVSQFVSVPYALYAQEAGNAQNFVAGTGINIDDGVITNTAPDKTVTVASGNGISATGTYPNFMITNTKPDQTVSIVSGTGISATGTYPNFTITNSSPDQNVTINSGYGITTSGTYPNFTITNDKPNATHSGDVTGDGVLTVTGLQGRPVYAAVPSLGQGSKWTGNRWAPTKPDSYTAGDGISINGFVISASDISPTNELQTLSLNGTSLSISGGNTVTLPSGLPSGSSGSTLRHNGTSWTENSFLYNDGSKLGVGTTTPEAKFTLYNGSLLATGSTGETPVSGNGVRMMWVPVKRAFRAGMVSGTQWDNDSLGGYSVAFGYNTKALSSYSAAFGNATRASGNTATALGNSTLASGSYSLATGRSTEATGNYSSAFGYLSKAQGLYSFATGYTNISAGNYSFTAGNSNEATSDYGFAVGNNNLASGQAAFSTGSSTEASGSNSSTFGYLSEASGNNSSAFGYSTTASGHHSAAFGYDATSQAFGSLVIGRYNVLNGTTDSWVNTDPLFIAGNGASSSARANAFTILKDGRTGINVSNPTYMFEIQNSGFSRSAYFINQYSGSSPKYGIFNTLSEDGTYYRYGIYNSVSANAYGSYASYGIFNMVNPNNCSGDVYGFYSLVSTTGTGSRYGIYVSAEGGWAGYFANGNVYVADAMGINTTSIAAGYELGVSGNGYFSNSLAVGSTTVPSGYKLAVDGKMICEEVKVQLSTAWPDYVFDESYRLLPLAELEKSIVTHHHLPGFPSSAEVEKDGLNLSEMTSKLTEKIEELTLYLLEVNRKVDNLQQENEWLRKQLSGE